MAKHQIDLLQLQILYCTCTCVYMVINCMILSFIIVVFRYNATFIDLPVARFSAGKTIHETQIVDAMRGLLENLKQQAHANLSTEDLKDSEPDIK